MQEIKSELLALLRRNDLLRAALTVGKVQDAAFAIDPYVEKVMELAARIWNRSSRAKNDPVQIARNINDTLYDYLGMQGDKAKRVIDDPFRVYLHTAIERKTASPLSMAALYSILAEQVGLKHEIVALTNSYFIKVHDTAADFYVDPFDNGRFLTQDEFMRKFRTTMQRGRMLSNTLFERLTGQQLIARMAQQLKHVYILKGKALEALRAVEILSGLFPSSPEVTRDRGILYCEMEYFSKAVEDLRYYLKKRPNAEDVAEVKKLASMLKGYREVMN